MKRLQVVQAIVARQHQQRPVLPTVITPLPEVILATTPPVQMGARMGAAVVQAVAWRTCVQTTPLITRAQCRVIRPHVRMAVHGGLTVVHLGV